MQPTSIGISFSLILLGSLNTASAQRLAESATRLDPVQRATVAIPSPFLRTADTGANGFATVAYGPDTYALLDELHESATLLELSDFPLPGGQVVDLLLRPVTVMEPGATATVIEADGTKTPLAPSVRLFSGSVPGRASRAFLGISKEMLHGYVSLDGEMLVLSSGPTDARGSGEFARTAAITHGDFFSDEQAASFCGTYGDSRATAPEEEPEASKAGKFQVDQTQIFLELDDQYRTLFGSNQAAIDYAVLLTGATSEIYRRDLAVTLTLPTGYVQLWSETPPWGPISTFGDIGTFSNWWKSPANPNRDLPRAVAHVLTSPVFGGVAQSIGGVCSKVNGYAISSVYGTFPSPIQHLSGSNWDLLVFAHENGHLYGSRHTFEYLPPIRCRDGSGPDSGTIMSYCHQTYGVGGVGMRFHLTVQDTMRSLLGGKSCKQVIKYIRGDYDISGTVDAADLAELDAYMAQGFVSRGAQKAFDFDRNGVVEAFDREILLLLMQGPIAPASSLVRNGTGSNCSTCYSSVTEPIVGGVWSTNVDGYFGAPVLTLIVGASVPLIPGFQGPYGELLIGMKGFGGQTLFQHLAMTDGQTANHAILIPPISSLIGLTVYTQAAIFRPTGDPLVNALDLHLAPF